MSSNTPDLLSTSILKSAQAAREAQWILISTKDNLETWIQAQFLPLWALEAIHELFEKKAWNELNDRFYKHLAFGTGGMRGRTIGDILTKAEQGNAPKEETPDQPAIGTNCLNDINIIRATLGLYAYCAKYLRQEGLQTKPKLVIAHDVRHFSRHFCLLTASTWTALGGEALIFEGPRSTPQLSFSVRHFKATAGIVITASHNPPHDNGFKVYFQDGGQVVSPHAENIIKEVNAIELKRIPEFFTVEKKGIYTITHREEQAYLDAVKALQVYPGLIAQTRPKVVYTPIHGTGQVCCIPILESLGADLHTVKSQLVMDPHFPTVQSPNPENAEALTLAIKEAESIQADAVIATDPDDDRMGVAVRDNEGKMQLLSGNVTGSLLAEFRITSLKEKGFIPQAGTLSAVIIKTFVTTPLQEAIAKHHGLKIINTLTGFKWIASKLLKYEQELLQKDPTVVNYDGLSPDQRRQKLLAHSTYFVYGNEESYGYLAGDTVRDKDANAATLMFVEFLAYLKKQKLSVIDYLDAMYLKYGYYHEKLCNLYYEGAMGAQKIKNILESYKTYPPKKFGDAQITRCTDFSSDTIRDADGDIIPKENFFFLELNNGYRYAVRGSGTEPKIKFYLFAHEPVGSDNDLQTIKKQTETKINHLGDLIEADAHKRSER